ncbi:MAG: anthranilate synthase component I, partial [Euryarchaeota archaeon]|nr:anthranilate synthase component I [Euryarchaeota archaeon]
MIELSPTLSELTTLLESVKSPAIIQLTAKIDAICTPIDLYAAFGSENPRYSYLLESVEKEKRHARFSFVGSDPDAVVTVSGRTISLEYETATPLIEYVEASLSEINNCGTIR